MRTEPFLHLDDLIKAHIEKALDHCQWNQQCAAGLLGITPRKLNYQMWKRGIPRAKDIARRGERNGTD